MKELNLTLRPAAITRSLALIVVVLGLVNIPLTMIHEALKSTSWTISNFFYCLTLDSENSLPAWFSTLLLLYCGILTGVAARTSRANNDRWWRHWSVLAIVFVGLSIDEFVGFHEMAIMPLRKYLGTGGLLFFAWVIPGAIFVLGFGLAYLKFVLSQVPGVRNGIIAGGAIYVGGAIGCEIPGGWLMDHYGAASTAYTAMATLEECLEMVGLLVFSHTLLTMLASQVSEVRVELVAAEPKRETAARPLVSPSW